MTIQIKEITGKLVIDYNARDWCLKPYPDHPKGCPNYGKKAECPPHAPKIEDWLDLCKKYWIIVVEFDLKAHIKRMKQKHPNWSKKQCKCVLYWQNTVRKELREACKDFQEKNHGVISSLIPEAMGVHVIRTARKVGIPIKVRNLEKVYKIALLGYPAQNRQVGLNKFLTFAK